MFSKANSSKSCDQLMLVIPNKQNLICINLERASKNQFVLKTLSSYKQLYQSIEYWMNENTH